MDVDTVPIAEEELPSSSKGNIQQVTFTSSARDQQAVKAQQPISRPTRPKAAVRRR